MPEDNAALRTEPLKSQEETARPSDTQPFYGWRIVAAGTVILFVSSGIGFYGHGVILDPLRTMHGWSKATISSAITLYFLTAGIMGMIVGRQVDRYGPKWVLILGSVVICAGFLFLGFIRTVFLTMD
jgi:MFS family permease